MVKPQFVDECRLLFYKVYQEPPRSNEIYLKFATCFVYKRRSIGKADLEAHKIAWALFAENVILSLKRNPVAWKRKVDAFRDTHGPINVITTGDSMAGPSMQADMKGRPELCFMSSVIKKLRAKILDIQSNNKAKVLMKNELKEKKAKCLNKRDALIRREATTSVASMIQTKIMSLQTRYGTLKGANAIAEQLAAVEAKVTAMSNAVKLIEGDDKIANMKIAMESIELGCNERITEIVKSMLVGHNPRASPYFQEPTASSVKTKVLGWSDAEGAHHMSFETGRGYTENAVGNEEQNVSDLEIASPGGAEKSWSDREAAKNVGHDTVSPESIVLGATSEEGIEAVLGGDMESECVFGRICEEVQINQKHNDNYCTWRRPIKENKISTMQKDAGIYLQTDSCTVPSFDSNDAHPKPRACKKL
ncbi:hypothetical protein L7F22_024379 [Adiantum nelumboides]|nr:hypothetical protein [Adiantum nelumboides]